MKTKIQKLLNLLKVRNVTTKNSRHLNLCQFVTLLKKIVSESAGKVGTHLNSMSYVQYLILFFFKSQNFQSRKMKHLKKEEGWAGCKLSSREHLPKAQGSTIGHSGDYFGNVSIDRQYIIF